MSANRPLVSHPRRRLLQAGTLAFLLGRQQIAFGASVVAVRVWPAPDYSRVTLESDKPLKTTQTFIPNPPRLAVDIQGMQLTNTLKELAVKVQPDDPNIASIRIGQNSPNVVRMVLDLKQAANPQDHPGTGGLRPAGDQAAQRARRRRGRDRDRCPRRTASPSARCRWAAPAGAPRCRVAGAAARPRRTIARR